ncbi:hypothetical protein BRCON_1444 [Candidatus Sumerlaea chitinivorans]|uniref:Uncharacterized protein n=1 Tax=Sumerlaea chitinivorans TaxID=2250252 RepID=A0A2Z4Y4T3_SUMC1|nr:hypothetical protein BRCON_1444 [Candidatus Sumerlaea chitinivorans]
MNLNVSCRPTPLGRQQLFYEASLLAREQVPHLFVTVLDTFH